MTRNLLLIGILSGITTCALAAAPTVLAPAGNQSKEQSAVLAAMDRYMLAITAKDAKVMAALKTSEVPAYRAQATEDGDMKLAVQPLSHWFEQARVDKRAYRERYWSPTVLIRGRIAIVWAPYEFWIDGRTSHCGIDVFDFVKVDTEWRVANAMWTVEPNACPELRPKGVTLIRPEDR